jgi:hypothetical protein
VAKSTKGNEAKPASRKRRATSGSKAQKPKAPAKREAPAGTRAAGRAISLATTRAGVPLAVGGALAAGVAGSLAVVRRRRRRRAVGFDVSSAAERVGALAEEIGRVAIVVQKAADGSKRSK